MPATQKAVMNEVWRDDGVFNQLINDRARCDSGTERHKELTRNIKKRVRHLKNKKLREEADEINLCAQKRDLERLYRCYKNETSTFKSAPSKDTCDPVKLKEYFQTHFATNADAETPIELENAPEFVRLLKRMSESSEINSEPPTKNEIIDTLKTLNAYKSSNDLPVAYIKYAVQCDRVLEELEKLFRLIWATEKQPSKWGNSKLVTLWKGAEKGMITDPKAYRGIQVGSALCKIMVAIILNRLKQWYNLQLSDQQQGFRQGRGTTDAIFILKRVQQICRKGKKKVYALFIDLTAAFDHVNRKWMFQSILQRLPEGNNKKMFRILQSIYAYTTTALSQCDEDIFELFSGVRQGGPESPMLYNLYMDYVMRIFIAACKEANINFFKTSYCIPGPARTQKHGVLGKFGSVTVDWLGYADDLVLLFKDLSSLLKGLNLLNETFRRYQLEINTDKTKTMILNFDGEFPDSISNLEGNDIDNVKIFRYLGCKIHYKQEMTGDDELSLRKESANCRLYALSKKFFNRKIILATRVQLLNSLVRTRLTYSCPTWCLTKAQMDGISAEYVTTLRKLMRNGFKRKEDSYALVYINKQIYELCRTTPLYEYVAIQQRSYLAHIIRQDDNMIAKKLLFDNESRHTQGRSITLMQTVMENETCTKADIIYRAMNRTY